MRAERMSPFARSLVEAYPDFVRQMQAALIAAAAALEEDNAAAAQAEPTALNAEESIVPD